MLIIVCMPVTQEHKELLIDAAKDAQILFCEGDSIPTEALSQAEVIIGNPPISALTQANALKLLQINSAGTGEYLRLQSLQPKAALCCATGSYGLAISEHMIGCLLMLMKNLALYRDNQFSAQWKSLGFVDSLEGARVLCVGMGDIGSAFAQRASALGAHVCGVRRTAGDVPSYCEAVYPTNRIDEIIGQFDVVALSMPETPDTIGFLHADRIAKMRNGSYLLNVGRGSAVDQDALLSALRSGKLKGAALDVTTPEPLPPDHPLWQEPRCIITPHISGGYRLPETHTKIIRLACQNITALREGLPLSSLVDYATGYAHSR